MNPRLLIYLFLLALLPSLGAQQLSIRKGMILDSIPVQDSLPENFALYLPASFEARGQWPVLFVFDMQGRGRQALGMFREAAEKEGYILAASNQIRDSLPVTEVVLIANRMFNTVFSLFPIQADRVYTAGYASGGRMASIIPSFVKQVRGVISAGAGIPNPSLLNEGSPFYYIGLVGERDFNYQDMRATAQLLDSQKFPNRLLILEGGHEWPNSQHLGTGLEILTLHAMAKGNTSPDSVYVLNSYQNRLQEIAGHRGRREMLRAYELTEAMIPVYSPHRNVDSLRNTLRAIKRDKLYRSQKREESQVLFQESLLREEYVYYLEEDVLTHNYNNLGWWNHQMELLSRYKTGSDKAEQHMGYRLEGFLNALIDDYLDEMRAIAPADEAGLLFLWMLKTLTEPLEYSSYLEVISQSAKREDYGTALFYLEELLKRGFKDSEALYTLEHTALLRITPEFNTLLNTYLKESRYEIREE